VSYFSVISADAPRNWWRCAEIGGNLFHDVGSHSPPQDLSHFRWATLGHSGPTADGGSAGCLTNDAPFLNSKVLGTIAPYSIELWAWPWGNPPAETALFELQDVPGSRLGLRWEANGTVRYFNVGVFDFTTATQYAIQAWHHFVVTRTGLLTNLYIDGALAHSAADVSAGPVGPFAIGFGTDWVGTAIVFGGNIAEMAIYPTALTLARVIAHDGAAEQSLTPPVFGGNFPGSYPSTASGSTSLDALILASVRKTFP